MTRSKKLFKVLLLIALAVVLTGCSIGPTNIDLDKWFHVKSVQEQSKRRRMSQKIDSSPHTAGTSLTQAHYQSVTAPMVAFQKPNTAGIDVEILRTADQARRRRQVCTVERTSRWPTSRPRWLLRCQR